MTTNLYLIRHGEAYSNVEAVIGGMHGDRGLTERGIAQAQALARRLAKGEIAADVLYSSTLPRARMTAELVAEALKLPITWDDVVVPPALRELAEETWQVLDSLAAPDSDTAAAHRTCDQLRTGYADLYDEAAMRHAVEHYFGKKGKVNPKNAQCFDRGADEARKQL